MSAKRYILLDFEELRLCTLIPAATGVVYQQQYGGHACRQGQVEGYLLPVSALRGGDCEESVTALRDIFEVELVGWGWHDDAAHAHLLTRLREAVAKIATEAPGQTPDDLLSRGWQPLALDESRLGDLDEAWVPVRTAHGQGTLVWSNSD
jgi:hypothetical protein